jgi:succinate-semialdehyde dehydrogenase / glutarate-semialdehyde dehydrogenase
MMIESVNPADGRRLGVFEAWDEARVDAALTAAARAGPAWAGVPLEQRTALLREVAALLRARQNDLARLITLEMGKLIGEARAEIAKCALGCDYYADHAAEFLADEPVASDAGRSFIAWQPLGVVLAVMPWNFPFWQVFRFAAPALAAGNVALLKHASNVPQCALAIEGLFRDAGLPDGMFTTLMIPASAVARVIGDTRVRAVTLTGSEAAGRKVAASAGAALKKTVLELGGSDAFIVLEDADLEHAVNNAIASRFMNAGQSCIAAKRFIVVDAIADAFVAAFRAGTESLTTGDPQDAATKLAPLARADLREDLHHQVQQSIALGAELAAGGAPLSGPGFFYPATILDRVAPGMPAFDEELFGPVAGVVRVRDEDEAVAVANASRFGLGGSVWTTDLARGEAVARRLECGGAFVNGIVKSDPRLPFGGVKDSGYGRELSVYGLREFVNIKTVWIR